MKTWRQLTANEQQEARDWWDSHEDVYAAMGSPEKQLASIFTETPLPPPWPQPPVDIRGVVPEQLGDHDWSAVVVPDSVYERLESDACFTDEDDEDLRAEVADFTGVPAKHFRTNLGKKFAKVLLTLEH